MMKIGLGVLSSMGYNYVTKNYFTREFVFIY